MISNDQAAHHLLIWISRQQIQIGEKYRIYSFDQVKHSHIIPSILTKINQAYFINLKKQFNFRFYFENIEKYLNQIEDVTFKKAQRQQLIQAQSICQLVKLILYLVMKIKIKDEFVNRILQLEEETQMYLMGQIKRVHGWLQNKMEFNQIHQKISELEQQNEALNKRLVQVEVKCKQVANFKTQLQQENSLLEEQHRRNINQKNSIMQQLAISHPKDYTLIYKDIIGERNHLIQSYEQCQELTNKVAEQNSELKQKIVQDALIIDHLNAQICKYKGLYQRLKISNQPQQYILTHQESFSKSCETTLSSTRLIRELERDQNTSIQYEHTTPRTQSDDDLSVIMHNYNEDLVSKLQVMYNKIGKLNTEISTLKTQNKKIAKDNRHKQKRIAQVSQLFQDHTVRYAQTINA